MRKLLATLAFATMAVTGYGAEQYRGVRRRKLPQCSQFQLDQRTLRGVDVNRDDAVGLGE